jgi:hypothetical protein
MNWKKMVGVITTVVGIVLTLDSIRACPCKEVSVSVSIVITVVGLYLWFRKSSK